MQSFVLLLVSVVVTPHCPERLLRAIREMRWDARPSVYRVVCNDSDWHPTEAEIHHVLLKAIDAKGIVDEFVPLFDGTANVDRLELEVEWGGIDVDPTDFDCFSIALSAEVTPDSEIESEDTSDHDEEIDRDDEDEAGLTERIEDERQHVAALAEGTPPVDPDTELLWVAWKEGGDQPHIVISFRVVRDNSLSEIDISTESTDEPTDE